MNAIAVDLRLLPQNRPVAFLLRHAERPAIVEGHVGPELSLTESGRAASLVLGMELGTRLRSCRASPIRRCRETAVLICEGAHSDIAILEDRILGGPSLLVVDEPVALQNWERLGNEGVIEHLASSDTALPGMLSGEEAGRRLRSYLLATLDEQHCQHGNAAVGIHLLVTHDSIVSTLVSRSLRLGRAVWPRYLQGAALWRDEGKTLLAFDGSVHAIVE